MKPAADVMAEAFETVSWHEPSFPVVSNVDGSAGVPRRDKGKLSQTDFLAGIVDKCMNTLKQQGCDQFLECGPGNVLCGLSKRIAKQSPLSR